MTHQHKIPDEVVVAASDAYMDGAIAKGYVYAEGTMADHRELIKAAIQTALSMLLGEPKGWIVEWPDAPELGESVSQVPDGSDYSLNTPLYALKEKQS